MIAICVDAGALPDEQADSDSVASSNALAQRRDEGQRIRKTSVETGRG
jgi:hypothetical protein